MLVMPADSQAGAAAATRDDCLDYLLASAVQPALGPGRVYLLDFPVSQAALARIRTGTPHVAERFELYVDGIEIAPTAIMNSEMQSNCIGVCGSISRRGARQGDRRQKWTNGCSPPTRRDCRLAPGSRSDWIDSSCSPAVTGRCATCLHSPRTPPDCANETLRPRSCRTGMAIRPEPRMTGPFHATVPDGQQGSKAGIGRVGAAWRCETCTFGVPDARIQAHRCPGRLESG